MRQDKDHPRLLIKDVNHFFFDFRLGQHCHHAAIITREEERSKQALPSRVPLPVTPLEQKWKCRWVLVCHSFQGCSTMWSRHSEPQQPLGASAVSYVLCNLHPQRHHRLHLGSWHLRWQGQGWLHCCEFQLRKKTKTWSKLGQFQHRRDSDKGVEPRLVPADQIGMWNYWITMWDPPSDKTKIQISINKLAFRALALKTKRGQRTYLKDAIDDPWKWVEGTDEYVEEGETCKHLQSNKERQTLRGKVWHHTLIS